MNLSSCMSGPGFIARSIVSYYTHQSVAHAVKRAVKLKLPFTAAVVVVTLDYSSPPTMSHLARHRTTVAQSLLVSNKL